MEHIKAELERLYRRLYELDKEYEKNKGIRHLLTIILFAAVKMVLLSALYGFHSMDVFLLSLLGSAVLGTVEYFVCLYIFNYHFNKCNEEHSHIEYIKKQIAELEKEQKKGR